jgi:hypothetical protein
MKTIHLPFVMTAAVLAVVSALSILQYNAKPTASIVSQLKLPARADDGRNIDEISGLAWNHKSNSLAAISDDGVMFDMKLGGNSAAPSSIKVAAGVKLSQTLLKSKNAEALDVVHADTKDDPISFITSYEDVGKFAELTPDKANDFKITEIASVGSAIDNDGVEALASLRGGGLAFAYERRPLENAEGMQSIFFTGNSETIKNDFTIGTEKKWRVKAIDQLSASAFLVLLRSRVGDSESYSSKLTLVRNCDVKKTKQCNVQDIEITNGTLDGPSFEGMTVTPAGQVILAADRKNDDGPTELYILQTNRLPTF